MLRNCYRWGNENIHTKGLFHAININICGQSRLIISDASPHGFWPKKIYLTINVHSKNSLLSLHSAKLNYRQLKISVVQVFIKRSRFIHNCEEKLKA